MNNLNRCINCQEIEFVIKNLPAKNQTNKNPGPDGFRAEFYQNFQEELIHILLKVFQIMETEGALPNIFYEAGLTLIPTPRYDLIKKENYRAISRMNMNAKIFNRILTKKSKKSSTIIKLASSQSCRDGSTY